MSVKKVIEVYSVGLTVRIIGLDEIDCIITGVFIRKGLVQYEVQYNNKGSIECILVIDEQFTVKKHSEKIKIGFK